MRWMVGQLWKTKLIEPIDDGHWIVSLEGRLIQVRNSTGKKFTEGQEVELEVLRVRPLQLKIVGLSLAQSSRGFRRVV